MRRSRYGTWDIETEVMIHDAGIEKVRIGPKFGVLEPLVTTVRPCFLRLRFNRSVCDPEGWGYQSQDDDESVSYVMDLPEGVRLGYEFSGWVFFLSP